MKQTKNLTSDGSRVARTFNFVCAAILGAVGVGTASAANSIGGSDLAFHTQLSDAATSDLLLVGPIEALDYQQRTIQSLGQSVRMPSGVMPKLRLGTVVSVHGRIAADGSIVSSVIAPQRTVYVAGASSVLLRGQVTGIDRATGKLAIGRLVVDYTPTLHALDADELAIGSLVLLAGTQPIAGGVVMAQAAIPGVGTGQASSIGGSDISSVGGSDAQERSIGGSDLSSIGGSDRGIRANSIGGSDLRKRSIGGSDVQARSIGGSDLSSIGGSDLRKRSIGGSDVQARSIGGSDLSSIGGSDLRKRSIGGSDVQVRSIGGSDLSSIGGSDVQARSIGGSDLSSIGGSDRRAYKNSIGGSDLQ